MQTSNRKILPITFLSSQTMSVRMCMLFAHESWVQFASSGCLEAFCNYFGLFAWIEKQNSTSVILKIQWTFAYCWSFHRCQSRSWIQLNVSSDTLLSRIPDLQVNTTSSSAQSQMDFSYFSIRSVEIATACRGRQNERIFSYNFLSAHASAYLLVVLCRIKISYTTIIIKL